MLEFEPTIRQRRRFGVFLLSAYRELRTVYPGGFETFLVATCARWEIGTPGSPST